MVAHGDDYGRLYLAPRDHVIEDVRGIPWDHKVGLITKEAVGKVHDLIRLGAVWIITRRQVYAKVIPYTAQYRRVGDILDSASLRRSRYRQLICRPAYKVRVILFLSV